MLARAKKGKGFFTTICSVYARLHFVSCRSKSVSSLTRMELSEKISDMKATHGVIPLPDVHMRSSIKERVLNKIEVSSKETLLIWLILLNVRLQCF
jgi:hypothetical protein